MEKPEAKFRVGAVSAAVWKRSHTTKDGRKFDAHQVSIDRTYQDSSGNFQTTNNYGPNDIPKAILALQKAYDYVQSKADNEEN